jgi:protein dithiol oxidoreductase (disulfide-forming)
MNRTALLFTAITSAIAFVGSAAAEPAFAPISGQHYRVVDPAVATEVKPGQIEVIEFFSYGCPHCAEFEPYLQSWLKRKPSNVVFKRLPAVFNPFFRLMGRVHFALDDLGATERIAPMLFDAIHVKRDPDPLRPLGEWQNLAQRGEDAAAAEAEKKCIEAFARYVGARGVDAKKFTAAINSPSVMVRIGRADATFKRYGALGVPALGVNGRYFTSTGRPFAVRNFTELLGTLDHLVTAEAKAKR